MAYGNFDAANKDNYTPIKREDTAGVTLSETSIEKNKRLLTDHIFANQQWLSDDGKKETGNDDKIDFSEASTLLKKIDRQYGDGNGEITVEEIDAWQKANKDTGGHNAVESKGGAKNDKGLKDLEAKDIFDAFKSLFNLETKSHEGDNKDGLKIGQSMYEEYEQELIKDKTESTNDATYTFTPQGYTTGIDANEELSDTQKTEAKTEIYKKQALNLAQGEIDKYDGINGSTKDGKLNFEEYKEQQKAIETKIKIAELNNEIVTIPKPYSDADKDKLKGIIDNLSGIASEFMDDETDYVNIRDKFIDYLSDNSDTYSTELDELMPFLLSDFNLADNQTKLENEFNTFNLDDSEDLDANELASKYIFTDELDDNHDGKISMNLAQDWMTNSVGTSGSYQKSDLQNIQNEYYPESN